jgi:MFS family permease
MAHLDATAKRQTGLHMGRILDPARPSHPWWVAATVMLSGLLVPMNQTAMQVALPQIMTVFGLDLDQAQWIVSAYVIAEAMLVPPEKVRMGSGLLNLMRNGLGNTLGLAMVITVLQRRQALARTCYR